MNWNPGKKYQKLVALAQGLLQEERRTVRDVYYALESRGYHYDYRKVGRAVKLGRLAGMIDPWRVIDTSRNAGNLVEEGFDSPKDFIENALENIEENYTRNFWDDLDQYIEVWLEKAGLSSVFSPICEEWNVRLELLRGDWSTTKCYEATARLSEKLDLGKDITILYFGDYNPSGFHAPVAVQNTMQEFGLDLGRNGTDCEDPEYFDISPLGRIHYQGGGSLKFDRIAMTTEQVKRFELPKNPTPSKSKKDRKIREYFIKFVSGGDRDIELNALKEFEREYLEDLIEDSIKGYVNLDVKKEIETKIKRERGEIRERITVEGGFS